ncbi:hypothetical protein AYI70_g1099 [Smittium culicis]|uniref:Uncharacterized protein n=1 Tax=Smittium culicis TaxID=133412 RepID=A0A1R1YDZ7_9FUNG|nr:hypothetical protein AYI70_g1099 [Smittium culicis]
MDQHYMQIIQDLTEKVNDLSEIVRQGFPQRQTLDVQVPECDDIHRRTVVPAVEIESFPELLELIPDLEKDFFRIQLAEKARKDIIYGCPKFTGMNYRPPPLNDAAPTSVKRTDAMQYKIQKSLASLTRPLDHYVYEQIRKRRLVDLDNDGDIILVETMRTMLADLASTITKDRIDNMHKIMDLPGRAPQLVESSMKPLFTEDQLDTMISTKKTATSSRTQRKSPFRQRQQPGYSYPAATALIQQATPAQHIQQSRRSVPGKEEPKISSKGLEKGKFTQASKGECRSAADASTLGKRLIEILHTRRHGRGPPADAPSPSPQEEDDPGGERGHHKGGISSLVEESYREGEGENPRVLQRPLHDPKEDGRPPPREVFGEHREILFPVDQPGIQNQHEEVEPDTIPINISFRDGNQFQIDELKGPQGQDQRSPHGCEQTSEDGQDDVEIIEEKFAHETEKMNCDGTSDKTRSSEFRVLETETTEMELSVIHPGNAGNGSVYRCKRHCLGNSCGIKILLRHVASLPDIPTYKREGDFSYIKSSSLKSSCWEICVNLLRKHHIDFLCQEVWRNHLKSIIEDFRRHLVTLYEIEYQTANDVCPNIPQSCRCAKKTDCSNGVVSIGRNFQKDRNKVWSIRRRPVCIETELQSCKILQLVSRSKRSGDQCTITTMVTVEQPLLLSTVESDLTNYSESKERESYNDNSDSVMGIRNLVSRPHETSTRRSYNDTGNGDHSRPQKRKIPTDGQQTMVAIGVEDHRSSLENQGYNKEAIALLLPNERLLDSDQWHLFIKNVEEMNIKTYNGLDLDITPILDRFESDGPSDTLTIKDLTSKICWLLAVCGLLRASDIHRIDDIRTIVYDHELRFIIVASKEKRGGRPIEKQCVFKAHNNRLLFPVYAYKIYIEKVAFLHCPRPHLNDKSIVVNHLFRYSNDNTKPLSVDSISRNIKSITGMITNKGNKISKARAIGATLAANSGVSAVAIISQANWSGFEMFDKYYRLNRNSGVNLTNSIL